MKLSKLISGFFLIFPLCFAACDDDDTPPVEEEYVVPEEFLNLECPATYDDAESDKIIGTWRLVRTERYDRDTQQSEWKDYSCNLIFYHFQEDGKLVVESSMEDEIPSETYTYTFQPYKESEKVIDENGAVLIIDLPANLVINSEYEYYAPMEKGTLKMPPLPLEGLPSIPIAEYTSYLLRVE